MADPRKVFNIIKHAGEPQEGTLPDGRSVYRLVEITERYASAEGTRLETHKCAPYDNHFIYKVPKDVLGPLYCCSCGSMAILTGSKAYSHQGSAQGRLWVCKMHLDTDRHADGSS